jgi:hypothetical protein
VDVLKSQLVKADFKFNMDRLPMKRKANRSVGKVVVPKQLKVADRGYEVLTQDGRHVKSRSQENLLERNESNSG